jgi:hypothetical protein
MTFSKVETPLTSHFCAKANRLALFESMNETAAAILTYSPNFFINNNIYQAVQNLQDEIKFKFLLNFYKKLLQP